MIGGGGDDDVVTPEPEPTPVPTTEPDPTPEPTSTADPEPEPTPTVPNNNMVPTVPDSNLQPEPTDPEPEPAKPTIDELEQRENEVDDQSYLDDVVLDDESSRTKRTGVAFTEQYKAELRAQGFSEAEILMLEQQSINGPTPASANTDNASQGKVTQDSSSVESGGDDSTLLIVLIIVILIVLVPCLIWFTIWIIARTCPDSALGKKFNRWKEKRALNAE